MRRVGWAWLGICRRRCVGRRRLTGCVGRNFGTSLSGLPEKPTKTAAFCQFCPDREGRGDICVEPIARFLQVPVASASESCSQCCSRRTSANVLFRTDDRDNGHPALRRPDERIRGAAHRRRAPACCGRRSTGSSPMAVWASEVHVRAPGHWPRAVCVALSAPPLARHLQEPIGHHLVRRTWRVPS